MERQIERDIATKRHRERADNKNPEQSWVAQLVYIYKRLRPRKKIRNRKKERATETLKSNTKPLKFKCRLADGGGGGGRAG